MSGSRRRERVRVSWMGEGGGFAGAVIKEVHLAKIGVGFDGADPGVGAFAHPFALDANTAAHDNI